MKIKIIKKSNSLTVEFGNTKTIITKDGVVSQVFSKKYNDENKDRRKHIWK